ncbi:hypothetical protein QUF63_12375 [Anaerolineales bacterium HSG25]|nr:hypothetical protein [Anaerolineales bacterium HSG25]
MFSNIQTNKFYPLLLLFILLFGLLIGCNLSDLPIGNEEDPIYSLEYQPPFVPVSLVLTEDGVRIGAGLSMVTPIGRFGVGADYPVADFGQVTLVIRDHTTGEDEVLHIIVENGVQILLQGTAKLSIGGNGVIIIDITEGQLQQVVLTNEAPDLGNQGFASVQDTTVAPITVQMDKQGQVELSQ